MNKSSRGVGRPPGSSGDGTRLLILREARACFAEFGYAGTTNRMIAERAGLTTAALYHHFGKKQELMLAVHSVTQTENYERMRAAIDSCDTFVGKVQVLLDVTHQTLEEDPEQALFASVARDEARRHPELKAILLDRRFPDLFAELIEFGIASGDLAADDATAATGVISILALGSAFVAPDMSTHSHALVTEGIKRLLAGDLLRQRVNSSAAQERL
jgi:AcrR family transcriptional regulator